MKQDYAGHNEGGAKSISRPEVRDPLLHTLAVDRQQSNLVARLHEVAEQLFSEFPWQVIVRDWLGNSQQLGGSTPHWSGDPLVITVKTKAAARAFADQDVMKFLEMLLSQEVDLEGNLYLLPFLRKHAKFGRSNFQRLFSLLKNSAFQTTSRARFNVKSHYDIPQDVLNVYLDKVYLSYSCGMFAEPDRVERDELLRVGSGEADDFDSLEKAQWRKFKDAIDFVNPNEGDTLLDVGCGYGGQIAVALKDHLFGKVVGWTHSANQVSKGNETLSTFDARRWELNEGDYRDDERIYDHITSTGMISHVGPRGLVPYVCHIRKRIKTGGRYVHHALMIPHHKIPLNFMIGPSFNKKYVWPGFHWFTLGTHVKALEKNGFAVTKALNLSPHYAKTTAAWHERFRSKRSLIVQELGEATARAWEIYLAGASGGFVSKGIHVYRLYCEAL